jgi:hypothetical protein
MKDERAGTLTKKGNKRKIGKKKVRKRKKGKSTTSP